MEPLSFRSFLFSCLIFPKNVSQYNFNSCIILYSEYRTSFTHSLIIRHFNSNFSQWQKTMINSLRYVMFLFLRYFHSLTPLNRIADQRLEDLDESRHYVLIHYKNLTYKHISELESRLILGDWLLKIRILITQHCRNIFI